MWIIALAWFLTIWGCKLHILFAFHEGHAADDHLRLHRYTAILMFVFSGLFIPFSSIFYETCFLLEEIPKDFRGYTAAIMPSSQSSSSSSPSPSPATSRRAMLQARILESIGVTGDVTKHFFSLEKSLLTVSDPVMARHLAAMPKIEPISIVDGCWKNQSIAKSLNLTAAATIPGAGLSSLFALKAGLALNTVQRTENCIQYPHSSDRVQI